MAAFVLDPKPTWTWPVVVRIPTDAGIAEQRFRARFRLIDLARASDLAVTADGTRQLLNEVVVELLDIVDPHGAPLPHSPQLLDAVAANPWCRQALGRAYIEAIAGQDPPPAAAGN